VTISAAVTSTSRSRTVSALTGAVENEQPPMAAVVAARSTPGVKTVKEELRVSAN
jgi:osmotically-inducible protein OsmY